jgi:hypothetical protein
MSTVIICILSILVIVFVYKRITGKKLDERDAMLAVDLTIVPKEPIGVIVPEQSVKPAPKPAVVKETKPEPVPEPIIEVTPEPVAEVKVTPTPAKAKTSGRPKKKK